MNVSPADNVSEGKKEQVEKMFNRIAFRYDLLNQLLSLGIHKQWRRKAIRLLKSEIRLRVLETKSELLDVATGTADFAIDATQLNLQKITGIDLAEEMLHIGRKKVKKKNLENKIELLTADAENIPFPENYFDAATAGFGVRNFENLEKGLREIHRVLKPGAAFAVLEFSFPEKFPLKQLYGAYLKTICPFLGKLISGDATAYSYLHSSVRNFPFGEKFKSILLYCGFREATFFPLTFGIATIYIARK